MLERLRNPAKSNTAQTLPEGPSQPQQEEGRGYRRGSESTAHRELHWLAPTQCLPIKLRNKAQKAGMEYVRGLGSPSSTAGRDVPCTEFRAAQHSSSQRLPVPQPIHHSAIPRCFT